MQLTWEWFPFGVGLVSGVASVLLTLFIMVLFGVRAQSRNAAKFMKPKPENKPPYSGQN